MTTLTHLHMENLRPGLKPPAISHTEHVMESRPGSAPSPLIYSSKLNNIFSKRNLLNNVLIF